MTNLKRISDVLFCSWVLANDQEPLPTGQEGILDRALETAVTNGAFPMMRDVLHFVPTSIGRRCAELRSILAWAQAADQTSDPNPSYRLTHPKSTPEVALGTLYDLGIHEDEARQWGQTLANAIKGERSREDYQQA